MLLILAALDVEILNMIMMGLISVTLMVLKHPYQHVFFLKSVQCASETINGLDGQQYIA